MVNRNGSNNGHGNGTSNGLVPVNGNGHKPDAAIVSEHDLLWDGLSPAVSQALGQPLDPALVSQRKGPAAGAASTTSKATPSSTRPTASSATGLGLRAGRRRDAAPD